MFTVVNGVLYIQPVHLLQLLEERARVIAERTAEPGLDALTTERLRGQRLETLTLISQITEAQDA